MADDNERMTRFERQLDSFSDHLDVLKHDVQKLRVLYEEQTGTIQVIAEVQSRHGDVLDEIRKALAPLPNIDHFVKRIGYDHERRITDLERTTGMP